MLRHFERLTDAAESMRVHGEVQQIYDGLGFMDLSSMHYCSRARRSSRACRVRARSDASARQATVCSMGFAPAWVCPCPELYHSLLLFATISFILFSMTVPIPRTPRTTTAVRWRTSDAARFSAEAARRGVSISALLRQCICSHLKWPMPTAGKPGRPRKKGNPC